MSKKYKDGEPCSHPGCMSHVSHPCEGCGRIWGKMDKHEEAVKEFAIDEGWAIDRYSLAKLAAFKRWLEKKREKETCEWKRTERDDGAVHGYEWHPAHSSESIWYFIPGKYCPDCGRRIVETNNG